MEDMNFSEAVERSVQIRKYYRKLEIQYHGKEWTVEEDALAFLTDAGLVGRLTMSQQERWPNGGDTVSELEHKFGECIWWLIVLAERMSIDIVEALRMFLTQTDNLLKEMNFSEVVERSVQIRKHYHQLEIQNHGKEWTVEEDALAFLTDAGLVGRLTMSQQKRWPNGGDTVSELEHKLGECIWWLIVLAERMNIDICGALQNFLTKTENQLAD